MNWLYAIFLVSIVAVTDPSEIAIAQIISLEDMYDTCNEIHKSVGSQGRKAVLNEASTFYGNITRAIVELFLDFSKDYQLKKKKSKNHGLVVKPIRRGNFYSRWQIDLIDFRT